jgi:hypothetical protein
MQYLPALVAGFFLSSHTAAPAAQSRQLEPPRLARQRQRPSFDRLRRRRTAGLAGVTCFPATKVVVSRHDDDVNDLGISGYQCFRWVAV